MHGIKTKNNYSVWFYFPYTRTDVFLFRVHAFWQVLKWKILTTSLGGGAFVKYVLYLLGLQIFTHIYITHHLNGSAAVTVFELYQKPLIFTAENCNTTHETQNYISYYLNNDTFITISVVNVWSSEQICLILSVSNINLNMSLHSDSPAPSPLHVHNWIMLHIQMCMV